VKRGVRLLKVSLQRVLSQPVALAGVVVTVTSSSAQRNSMPAVQRGAKSYSRLPNTA
jgi:hypothetical protein